MNSNGKKNCGSSELLVSYIYGEASPAERREFESHLSFCEVCTDELAGISLAHSSVAGWRREAFEPLATPVVDLPERSRERVGPWEVLLGWLKMPGLAIAASAAVVIIAAAVFFAIRAPQEKTDVAQTNSTNAPVAITQSKPAPVVSENTKPVFKQAAPDERDTSVEPHAVRAKVIDRSPKQVQRIRRTQMEAVDINNSTQKMLRKPVLSSIDDSDDKSLRLADLLDDIGG